ncbi:hypothetical protein LJC64_05430 [Ruminococcaceae bacterium OttesenSCG-928-A11]|nr:hypothetical protein [Ruminococcaceae bacterium OttesenSCG-928-A11]
MPDMPIEAPNEIDSAIIGTVINYLMIAVGIIAVVIILYAAFLMITASGEPDKFKKGKQALTAGVIGLLIAILGSVVVQVVISAVTSGGRV